MRCIQVGSAPSLVSCTGTVPLLSFFLRLVRVSGQLERKGKFPELGSIVIHHN